MTSSSMHFFSFLDLISWNVFEIYIEKSRFSSFIFYKNHLLETKVTKQKKRRKRRKTMKSFSSLEGENDEVIKNAI